MNANIRPLDGYALIKPYSKKLTTSSGLFLPESTKEYSNYKGKILRLGKGKLCKNGKRLPVEVKEGQLVFFTSYDIQKFNHNGQMYYIIAIDDIDAVYEN